MGGIVLGVLPRMVKALLKMLTSDCSFGNAERAEDVLTRLLFLKEVRC